MSRWFRGNATQKVDSKGRVSIPAPFRRVIEESMPNKRPEDAPEFVLVFGESDRNFLEGYTLTAIDEVQKKIAQLDRGSPIRRKFERMFSGFSEDMTINPTGQVLLKQEWRDKVGIKSEAYFIASSDTFQIWNKDAFDRSLSDAEDWNDPLGELDAAIRAQNAET